MPALYETVGGTPEPDIKLAGFSLWVPGRQFPALADYQDGNWLNIQATVQAPGAMVEVSGPWLRRDEVERFQDELTILHRELRGKAALTCMEPALRMDLQCTQLGQINFVVEITPDVLTQSHRFEFKADQSYLPEVLSGCKRVLERCPVVGSPG